MISRKQTFTLVLFIGLVLLSIQGFAQYDTERFSVTGVQDLFGDSTYQKEIEKALFWENEASNNRDSIYTAYGNIVQKLWLNDQYSLVLTFLNQLFLYEELADRPYHAARLHNFYANAALRTSQYETALSHYKECLDIYDSIQEPDKQAVVLINICVAYEQMGEYEKALFFGKRAFELFKQIDAPDYRYSICYTNLGNVYSEMDSYDTALTYYKKSIDIDLKLQDSSGVSYGYSNIGWLYYDQGKYDSALKYFERSVVIDNLYGSTYELMISSHNYGNLLYEQEKQGGVSYLLMSYRLAKSLNSLEYLKKNASILGKAYANQGDLEEAVEFYQEMYPVYDSLYNKQKAHELSQAMKSYDLYKSGLENEILKNRNLERQQELATAKVQMLYGLGIGAILIISLILLIRGRRRLLRQRKTLKERNEVIQKQKQKVEALFRENQELSSILVHDLRAPFSQIQVLKEILDKNPDYIKEDKDILMLMEKAAKNGLLLVDDLLKISRVSNWNHKLDVEEVELGELFVSSFNQFSISAESKNINFKTNLGKIDAKVQTDGSLLRGIVDNLVSNAIKYTPSGGNVSTKFEMSKGGTLKIEVSDDGPGFSEEDKKELYNKFAKLSARPTANESSTGLGLAIVKLYTEKLSGTISLETAVDKGARFTVFLPPL